MGRTWCRTDPIGFIGHFLDTSNVPSICPKETYCTKIVMLGELFSNMFFPIGFLGAAFLDKSKGIRLKIALNRATPNPIIIPWFHTPKSYPFRQTKKHVYLAAFGPRVLNTQTQVRGLGSRLRCCPLDTSGHVLNYPPKKIKQTILYII